MQTDPTDETAYDEFKAWSQSQGLAPDAALEMIVDAFYRRNLEDERLVRFFDGVDLERLKKHQFDFMRHVFSDGRVGKYTGKSLHQGHKRLIEEKGLNTTHFDYFVENLVASLKALSVPQPVIDRQVQTIGPLREIFNEATAFTKTREERLFFALDNDGDGVVPEADIRDALENAGLGPDDDRLVNLYRNLEANKGRPLDLGAFINTVGTAGLLVERALQGGLAIPDFTDFAARVDKIFEVVRQNETGEQATYIPPLAMIDPDQFGLAVVTIDGQLLVRGDHDVDFSIQSMCKPFNYSFAVEELGAEKVNEHVGNEPSGRAFNDRDLMQRLLSNEPDRERKNVEIPYNPMINAGAIMTAALVKSGEPFSRRFLHVREQWSRLMGTGAQREQEASSEVRLPRFNKEMARQENHTGYNNLALAYLLRATGKLPNASEDMPSDACPDDPDDFEFTFEPAVVDALKLYFSTCSLESTVKEIATAAATLANGGVCPTTQERVLKQSTVRSCLSVTQMCGMYDGSGNFFYAIGLPAKSGVGGGVMLIVPQLMGICIFSPRLDAQGNSVRGVDMAQRLVKEYRLHLYDSVTTGGDRIDPRLPLARWRASQISEALWAASKGDVRALRRLHEEQVNLEEGDYDHRTPMHLAAAEGHVEAIEFLLDHGVRPISDRWGGQPLSDARVGGHTGACTVLDKGGISAGAPHHRVDDPGGPKDDATEFGDNLAVVELLWAAAENNIGGLQRLVAHGMPVNAQDYDRRTALHLAAAEGQLEAVRYLVAHGHPLNVRDRWNATPLDEARREGRETVVNYLSETLSIGHLDSAAHVRLHGASSH
jgi:glutaminase